MEYRLFCLDVLGHILHKHEFEAADDGEAIRIAMDREQPELDAELWQLGRMITRLSGASKVG